MSDAVIEKYGEGCKDCCNRCLNWWTRKCPYGNCFDSWRSMHFPRIKITGEKREGWSHCDEPGEQDHWCRGGILKSVDVSKVCDSFVKYEPDKTHCETCLFANVTVFQDGYIQCSLVDSIGCEKCMEIFEDQLEREEEE